MSDSGTKPFQQHLMMSPTDFTEMGSDMTALIHGVIQTNLRTILEYTSVETPQALLDLQHRFAREYLAALQHGITMLVSALRPDTGSA
jgi:hypothetical protein